MRRFLLLYTTHEGEQRYAEGLIHVDLTVYLRGFTTETDKLFRRLGDVCNFARDHEDILSYHILILDKEEQVGTL